MVSPPGVPQTATSDATIGYTISTPLSPRDASTTSSGKGKGPAYPRPSVTPAEYAQQQRGKVPITTFKQPVTGSEQRPPSGVKGPLKVVNTTPRPESIAAFQKGNGAAVKVTGFTLGDALKTTDSVDRSASKDSVPEHSKWNVLRNSIRRGLSFSEPSATAAPSTPETSQPDAPRRPVERDTLEQLQDLLQTPGSTDKMQFFERYKRMAEAGAGPMGRSLSASGSDAGAGSVRHSRDVKGRAESLGSLVDEAAAVKSPSMVRLEEAYMDDRTHGFNARRNDPARSAAARPMGPPRLSGSRSTHDKRVQGNGSISSIDSAQADKMRMGEADLLTPSTSMDRLAEITPGAKPVRTSRGGAFAWEKEQDTIEGLLDKPKETPLDLEVDHAFSPNLSQATSGQSSRFRRESAASSLLAPSDSISTPGVNDKFHIDYAATAVMQARLKPGSKACQKCGQSLKGKRFIERDGMLLCEPDWKEMFLPKVSRAEMAFISVLNRSY